MRFSKDVFTALVGVALASEAEVIDRVDRLQGFVAACVKSGDSEVAEPALAEATRVLDGAREGAGAGDLDLGGRSFSVGRQAEDLGHDKLARRAYEVGLAALERDPANRMRGLLWQALGNAWAGENDERALECYRTAVELKRNSDDVRSRIISFNSLVEAETKRDAAESCEELVGEAIQVLEAVVEAPAGMLDDFGSVAYRLGRLAEAADLTAAARRVFELTLELIDAGYSPPSRGGAWHAIADTWLSEDEGERALEAFRAAAEHKRGRESAASCVVTLTDLASAELHWGEKGACESVLEEAVGQLVEAAALPRIDFWRLADLATTQVELAAAVGRPDLAAVARPHAGEGAPGDEAKPAGDQPAGEPAS